MSIEAKKAAASAKQSANLKDIDRLSQAFAAVLMSEDGQTVINHLWKRFGVDDRCFIADANGSVCPLRAAVRDGERSAIKYIFELARKSKPDIKPPTPTQP